MPPGSPRRIHQSSSAIDASPPREDRSSNSGSPPECLKEMRHHPASVGQWRMDLGNARSGYRTARLYPGRRLVGSVSKLRGPRAVCGYSLCARPAIPPAKPRGPSCKHQDRFDAGVRRPRSSRFNPRIRGGDSAFSAISRWLLFGMDAWSGGTARQPARVAASGTIGLRRSTPHAIDRPGGCRQATAGPLLLAEATRQISDNDSARAAGPAYTSR